MKRFSSFLFFSALFISLNGCNPLSYFNQSAPPPPVTSPTPPPPVHPISVTVPTPTPAPTPPPVVITNNATSLVGDYAVRGTNPGGRSNYSGSANISAGDETNTYKIHWRVGTIYDGIGKLEGNSLNVKWGTPTAPVGTVIYTLEPGGVLKGVWYTNSNPNALGSEILTPK